MKKYKVFRNGSSVLVPISTEAELELGMRPGVEVNMRVEKGELIITPLLTKQEKEFQKMLKETTIKYENTFKNLCDR